MHRDRSCCSLYPCFFWKVLLIPHIHTCFCSVVGSFASRDPGCVNNFDFDGKYLECAYVSVHDDGGRPEGARYGRAKPAQREESLHGPASAQRCISCRRSGRAAKAWKIFFFG